MRSWKNTKEVKQETKYQTFSPLMQKMRIFEVCNVKTKERLCWHADFYLAPWGAASEISIAASAAEDIFLVETQVGG